MACSGPRPAGRPSSAATSSAASWPRPCSRRRARSMSSRPSSSVRARPSTNSITKNGWPSASGSGSSHTMAGTGYPRARRIRMTDASRRPSVPNMPSCSIRTTPCPPVPCSPVQRTSSISRLNPPEMTVASRSRTPRWSSHRASRSTSSGSAAGGPPSGSRWWPVNSSSSGAAAVTSSSNHCRHSAYAGPAGDPASPVTASLSSRPAASSTCRSSAPGRPSRSRSTAARSGFGSGGGPRGTRPPPASAAVRRG